MTTRNQRKLAALNKENCEEHPRSNFAQNSGAPRSQEENITQVSEEIEGRVTKRLSKEFSRTGNRVLGALARLDDFLMNPILPGRSGTTPEPSRHALILSQGTNEDDSQNDLHPEADLMQGHDMVTGVQRERERERERVYGHDIVTGATQQIGNCHDLTGIHEEVTYCPPSTSSGKQKKNRSNSQPQFRSENIPATVKEDQILLALQQLANNNNSANFQNNINRISKLPKSPTTTVPTFDGKSEKLELFEEFFQTSLKIHDQLTEDDRINYFHSLMRGDALQTFKNINGPSRENLEEILVVFRGKYWHIFHGMHVKQSVPQKLVLEKTLFTVSS